MSDFATLFDTAQLAPFGACLLWRPELLWLSAGQEAASAVALVALLAALLAYFLRRREPGSPLLVVLLSGVLLAASATHLVRLWTLWRPDHGAAGLVAAAAALLALTGALALQPALSKALALPSAADLAREVWFRRDAEARARESEARLAHLFEHMADAVFVVALRPDGGFAYETVNAAFERIFGVERAMLLGRGPHAYLPDETTAAMIERRYAEALAGNAPLEYEASGFTRTGYRHWHTVLVPLGGSDGRVDRLLGSVRDMTETRRLQADLQETARLATVGSMCAGVAHEMSQPVNVIALWAGNARASLAAKRADPERLARALDVVLDQSRRIGTLLERMRELTRDDGGPSGAALPLSPRGRPAAVASAARATPAEPFDAASAVASVTEVASRQYAIEETVELTLDRPPGTFPVRGQRAKLEQALLHLIANAHDAVLERRAREPNAPARIAVALRADHAAGVVAIAVRDTGGGVPEWARGRVFDPFYTTKEPGRGTGLGLPIAQGVALSMGGRLETWNEATGTKEAGAVFCLTLPLVSPAPDAPKPRRVGAAVA